MWRAHDMKKQVGDRGVPLDQGKVAGGAATVVERIDARIRLDERLHERDVSNESCIHEGRRPARLPQIHICTKPAVESARR